MKILITNNYLKLLGGSETWTYSMAYELSKNNDVDVFTFEQGEVSERIKSFANIVNNPKDEYDLLIINHNTCLEKFKNFCGFKIFTSHGIFPSLEQPIEGADAYVSISKEVWEHLNSMGFNSKIIYNGIDLKRFYPRSQINQDLKNVFSLCKNIDANRRLASACKDLGLNFRCMNEKVWDIPHEINQADLVVSLGRGAYEAMACGRNVFIYDNRSYSSGHLGDGLNNLQAISNNFSGRFLKKEFTVEEIKKEFKKYDYYQGKRNRNFVAENFDIVKQCKKYLDLYRNNSVSVMTTVYNGYGKFVNKWLEGIKKQIKKPKEIILVLGKDHGLKKIPKDVIVVEYKKNATRGYLTNLGLERSTADYCLSFDVDDELLPNAIAEIGKIDADIIGLKYELNGEIQQTPEIKKENIKKWKDFYCGASGYLAVKKGIKYEDEEYLEYPLLFKSFKDRLIFKNTNRVCAVYEKRSDSHSTPQNIKIGFSVIEKYINKYLSEYLINKYSVIIPTMWASDKIEEMIKIYDKCKYISEILIVNNKPEDEIKLKSKKIKEIYRGKNIYVNPAWNLGVEEASEDNIIIANDDVIIKDLDLLLNNIDIYENEIYGPDITCFKKMGEEEIERYTGDFKIEKTSRMNWGYGTFMIMKKKSYKHVPRNLLIWEGDTIQFQANTSYCFKGIEIDTQMSETINKFNLTDKAKEDLKFGKMSKIKKTNDYNKSIDRVDFIIKTFKRYNSLNNLLSSIKDFYPNAHITIADDNDRIDKSFYARWNKELDINLIELPFDSGLSAGRNELINKTNREYILLLDDDFIFYEETKIEKFINVLDKERTCSIVGGMTLKNKKFEEHFEFKFKYQNRILTKDKINNKGTSIGMNDVFSTNSVLNFALFRRSVFDLVRWDEELKISEHLDFYFNAFLRNVYILYLPSVKIFHMKESNKDYKKYRKDRAEYFIKLGLVKNGIKKMIDWNGNSYEVIDGKLIIKKEV